MQSTRIKITGNTGLANVLPTFQSKRWNNAYTGPFKRVRSSVNHNASTLGCGCMQYRNFSLGSSANGESKAVLLSPTTFSNAMSSGGGGSQIKHIDLNLVEYIESVQQTGNVGVLFSDAPPVLWAVDALCMIKDLPGMTWISTIMLGTLLVRAIVGVPITIAQNRSMARLENLKPELKKLGEELKMETALAVKKFKWDEKTARARFTKSYKKHWRQLVENNNCHPMKSLALTLTQLPFWICFSSALRNVVYAVPLPRTTDKTDRWVQIYNESTPWVDSLVLPDPIVFPAVFLVMNFLNIEFNKRQRLPTLPETRLQKVLPWVMRGGIVVIALVATSVPSAVSMYWATSSSLAFLQNIILSRPAAAKRIFMESTSTSHLESMQKVSDK